jgi:hypothetical protein
MRDHLPHEFDPILLRRIEEFSGMQVNFPRILNRDLRPVVQNARMSGPRGGGATLFMSGIPYVLDPFRQFGTSVYAVFQKDHSGMAQQGGRTAGLISQLLKHNTVAGKNCRRRI